MEAIKLLISLLTEVLRVFNYLNERIVDQEKRIKTLEENFMTNQEQVQALDERLDTVESALNGEVTELKAIVDELKAAAAANQIDITQQLNRLSNVATRISGLSEAVVAPPPDVEVPSTPGAPVADGVTPTS